MGKITNFFWWCMGRREKKLTINIELPKNAVFELAGQGLTTNVESGIPLLEVFPGAGLTFFDDKLCPNLGNGLLIRHEQIAINEAELAVNLAGVGLKVERNGDHYFISVDTANLAGDGLLTDGSRLSVDAVKLLSDLASDQSKMSVRACTFVTNTSMNREGNHLVLSKTLTTYHLVRNCLGFLVDFYPVASEDLLDVVPIGDGYGYGCCTAPTDNERTPNFYKK